MTQLNSWNVIAFVRIWCGSSRLTATNDRRPFGMRTNDLLVAGDRRPTVFCAITSQLMYECLERLVSSQMLSAAPFIPQFKIYFLSHTLPLPLDRPFPSSIHIVAGTLHYSATYPQQPPPRKKNCLHFRQYYEGEAGKRELWLRTKLASRGSSRSTAEQNSAYGLWSTSAGS